MDETRYIGFFATGEHTFFLSAARTIALQREADCGIFDLFFDMGQSLASIGTEMVLAGRTTVTPAQCVAVIANGLIGGGMPEQEAREIVKTYCAPARPAMHDLALAWRILEAAIYGIQVKKKDGSRTRRGRSELRKGELIVNCGKLGLDWQTCSLSAYFEAVEASNELNSDSDKPKRDADPERLAKVMAARMEA